MGLSELFDTVDFDELIMIILTCIIAFSAYSQAKNTKKQAQLLKQTEERHNPQIRIVSLFYLVDSYVGFSITNASPFEVTLTSFSLGLGIPEDNGGSFAPQIDFPHITKFEDRELSDSTLPWRLKYGERMQILYNRTDVVEGLRARGNDQPARVLPQCYDSLGNKHTMHCWVTWEKDSYTAFEGPGPGYLTEEEARKKSQTSKRLSKRLLQSLIGIIKAPFSRR